MLFGKVSVWEVARVAGVCTKVVGWLGHARVKSRVAGRMGGKRKHRVGGKMFWSIRARVVGMLDGEA